MVTIKDIAEAAGVSIGTVDRILHDRGRYSQATAEKVRRIMKELHYTPNMHARGLKHTKEHIFSVILPDDQQDSGYWCLVGQGVRRGAEELASYGCMVHEYRFDRYSVESSIKALNRSFEDDSEGLVIAPVGPQEMLDLLEECRKPYLFIDSKVPEDPRAISYIGQDSLQSGRLAARLMDLLTARIDVPELLIIDPPGTSFHQSQRIAGFCAAMKSTGRDTAMTILKEEAGGEEAFHRFLEDCLSGGTKSPDGIFVANSHVYHAASYLSQREGNHIPLIGYDFIPERKADIEEGIIDFIITQQPEQQGFLGLMNLYRSEVLRLPIPEEVNTPLHIITKENVSTYVLRQSEQL